MVPNKNETGSDDWMAIYTATATSGGAARVGVNPYHSSTVHYMFHVLVFKGPTVNLIFGNQFVKYTQPDNSAVNTNLGVGNSSPSSWSDGHSRQAIYMGISSSPFGSIYSNTLNGFTNNLTSLGMTNGTDMAVQSHSSNGYLASQGGRGAYFVSFCHHTGGMVGSSSYNGKYGAISYSYSQKSYMPQILRKIPYLDGRFLYVQGYRE